MKRLRTLLISADKDFPHCSFHELGLDFYEFLQYCETLETTLFDAATSDPYPPYDINGDFDLVIFNYANGILMDFYPWEFYTEITVPRIWVNYENRKDNPWALLYARLNPRQLFQYMILPDTSEHNVDDTIVQIPRIVPRFRAQDRPVNFDRPVFSSYGLPSQYKDLLGQFAAITAEFDSGVYRLHCPPDSRSRDNGFMASMYQTCRNSGKNIELQFSQEFKPRDDLISWLNESDLNMFFYTQGRDQATMGTFPGSIDRAIAAQRPIAVQDWLCTKYITGYIDPYPKISLREIMAKGLGATRKMYEDGDPKRIAPILDAWVEETFL